MSGEWGRQRGGGAGRGALANSRRDLSVMRLCQAGAWLVFFVCPVQVRVRCSAKDNHRGWWPYCWGWTGRATSSGVAPAVRRPSPRTDARPECLNNEYGKMYDRSLGNPGGHVVDERLNVSESHVRLIANTNAQCTQISVFPAGSLFTSSCRLHVDTSRLIHEALLCCSGRSGAGASAGLCRRGRCLLMSDPPACLPARASQCHARTSAAGRLTRPADAAVDARGIFCAGGSSSPATSARPRRPRLAHGHPCRSRRPLLRA